MSVLYTDTTDFGGIFPGPAVFSVFGDDEDPAPGPFGDPHVAFIAPLTGNYTIAVTNFQSAGTPPYDFDLVARGITGVPEPSTYAMMGLGIAALGLLRRRK